MIRTKQKAKNLRFDAYWRYVTEWGNFKSDKWKKKSLLKQEIYDILVYGSFSKAELIEVKNFIKQKGFDEFLAKNNN